MMERAINRILGSISFRSGPVLRQLVAALPTPSSSPAKEVAPFRLLTIAGRSQLPIVYESLLSIARTWHRYPEIVVVTDGTTSPLELRSALDWWSGPLRVVDSEVYVQQAAADGNDDIVRFARRNVMGIKLAAVLYSAREAPTFAADTDVLWFKDFSSEVTALLQQNDSIMLRMSEDFQPAYHWEVDEALGSRLRAPPSPNAGVMFLSGDLLAAIDLTKGLAVAGSQGNFISEQTLFAWAAKHFRVPLWSQTQIACFNADNQSLRVSFRGKPWCARHYIGPVRHLFWRDAIALRLGVRP